MNPLMAKIKKICKDEEVVILFDAEERMDWGIPEVTDKGILLTAKNGDTVDGVKSWFYEWDDISLVAHYGFEIRDTMDALDDFSRQKIYMLQFKNPQDPISMTKKPFLCSIGIHSNENDYSRKITHDYKANIAKYPKQCKHCGKRSTLTTRAYIGDPLEITGEFSLLGSGIYVQQRWGAEAVIMPWTEINYQVDDRGTH